MIDGNEIDKAFKVGLCVLIAASFTLGVVVATFVMLVAMT